MAEEPRRSGRSTKGQHKNASSSPAPAPKPAAKSARSKPPKKSLEPSPATSQADQDEDDDEIRCICGNNNPKDKRAFIGCDICGVWQHNVCMGMPEDEEDVPDSYLCEQCGPQDHGETLQALAKGENIWETRMKVYQNEKKMSKNRKGKQARAGWLKKDILPPEQEGEDGVDASAQDPPETGSKRKRDEMTDEVKQDVEGEKTAKVEEKPTRGSRQDKRRRSAAPDADTAPVEIENLPEDRKKIAIALSNIIADDIQQRSDAGAYHIPDGHTSRSLGFHHGSRIEYALKMNHGNDAKYGPQFRALHANLKKNKLLIERLLKSSLTADELSTMNSADMASEELQKERVAMKEQLDRQAVAVQEEGPKYRRTHKGDELIEDVNAQMGGEGKAAPAQPVRERTGVAEDGEAEGAVTAGSPMQVDAPPLKVETRRQSSITTGDPHQSRTSSQQFDMNNIWAKTAQSPTSASAPRPMQMPPRRRSSIQPPRDQQEAGTKDDADVDRMLQDDEDETYSPADYTGSDGVVWRGKLIQSADGASPTVNARFVAGRDLAPTVAWRDLLAESLTIDGRLQINRAEEYLCSLQWSQSSDVSVLALTPYDDAEGFEQVFSYFKSRQRYAVVNKDKPAMVKDLYIIPLEAGQELPEHVGMLELCRLKDRAEERCLLTTLVVGRALGTPPQSQQHELPEGASAQQAANGHNLPQHVRAGGPGPAGSPLNVHSATFSPDNANNGAPQQQPPMPGYGIPPNPYGQQQSPPAAGGYQPSANPLVAEILGPLQFAPTAQALLQTDPNMSQVKLSHLRQILEDDVQARTEITALAAKLKMDV